MTMWRIGHRGACGHAPENTLLSMQKALELGVDGFEFDIQVSRDGEPVVIHDETLERTTNGRGNVSDYNLEELQTFNAGKGQTIPDLRSVLDMVDRRCSLFIELKAELATAPVSDLITEYARGRDWGYDPFFVCSFDHLQIAAIRTIDPNIQTCALLAGIPVSLAAIAEEAGAMAINPCIHHINQRLVDDAHRRGLQVFTWTANDTTSIAKARALGVDGIISDYPDRL